MKILGIIPARSGSKGIPGKNLRRIAGKPLLAYSIETARQARHLDRVIVSTDDDSMAGVAREYGAEVPFLRPEALARDEVSLIPVAKHAMEFFDRAGWSPDVVVSLQPTSPLLSADDVDEAIALLERTGCDAVVAVAEILHHHPFRAMKLEGDRVLPLTEYTSERYLQKQDRPKAYGFAGGLYVRRRHLLEDWSGRDFALGRDVRSLVIPSERAVNIDHEIDFLVFEALLKQREVQSLKFNVQSVGG